MEKNIIAALEISDYEVRLLVGEFFNTRLNILKVEQVQISVDEMTGFSNRLVKQAIRKAIVNASRNLGVVIEKVLLLIPSKETTIIHQNVELLVNGTLGEDIYHVVYKEVFSQSSKEYGVLINAMIKRILVNGTTIKKNLIGEICERLVVEVDYCYSDSKQVFDIASCVEELGCQIIDIGLDALALGCEMSLFEASIDRPVVAIRLEKECTYLSLFHKGLLISSQEVQTGTSEAIRSLMQAYQLPMNTATRLLYYNLSLSDRDVMNAPIYLWSSDAKTKTLYYDEFSALVKPLMVDLISAIAEICEPISNVANARYILTGEGAMIEGLGNALSELTHHEVETYTPETFGVRDQAYTALLGLFYLHKDLAPYQSKLQSSVNLEEFYRVVTSSQKELTGEDSITKRLKNFLFDR